MRLFTAVIPPPEALAELAAEFDVLRRLPDADRLRWTERAGWHFTLAFYGEVAEDIVPELRERLARAAHRARPHELWLAGGGRFGNRVLWVGADGDLWPMRSLADATAAAGRRAGAAVDEHRPYTPHLTIARGRGRGRHYRGEVDLVPFAAELLDFAGDPWTVEELCLVRSHPPTPGERGAQPRYETIGSWALGR
ncbi:RNA 2',3'-cyclic phosphodiesterase [Streptomyces sp. LX-29]|uniref:RNA 2',3'-cyclic phosphodiesterase n=1 Tax=Streptomyces sp. LX-29 TaxID=2900152 RepID=UPI00240DBA1E|nr:RNA 2',3'-cyclic phosphodiesterase [Streptomyces sp. LX-29]WFB08871.1 RNA 2',3'-cyclic phosphodiesterase [Streptomyces sp. LX-29]